MKRALSPQLEDIGLVKEQRDDIGLYEKHGNDKTHDYTYIVVKVLPSRSCVKNFMCPPNIKTYSLLKDMILNHMGVYGEDKKQWEFRCKHLGGEYILLDECLVAPIPDIVLAEFDRAKENKE
jgi:hypothetical protein